jgi:Transposase family tnp2
MIRYNVDNFLPLRLCPGPSQPKDLDSFLVPFIDELNILRQGVPAYDAQTESSFLLKAHLVLLSGDTPGISKLLHLRGHNAKYPCRACKLEVSPYKVAFKTKNGRIGENTIYYYPLHPPLDLPLVLQQRSQQRPQQRQQKHGDLIPYIAKLPLRTPDDYVLDGTASLKDPKAAVNSGINGISPLAHLPTITVPESAPFDLMHLVYLGFVPDLCGLLNGKFFTAEHLNAHDARISEKEWASLGSAMSKIRAPVSWGRSPRNIEKYVGMFKAEELGNFLIHYLLPLSFNRVNPTTYRTLQRLVLLISLATSYQITRSKIDEIEEHLTKFMEWYYDMFYQMEYERLPACSIQPMHSCI